ncbi:hypothetical protein [Blastococcus saxobsidens]|uniref:Glycosyltransferase RgtA/B/C/D-like domain-containing protein n=1 Tax=Blastococcus saxobsidens (strain DD2) TaxID=1146883 RepID=H6RL04_BLASD|nr:hypothetical protein [Blastococcus saxobsidens]CCG04971.1 membrane protein of unknown function [Blastococcus saxobsidens DD2]
MTAVVQLLLVTAAAVGSVALRRDVPVVPNVSAYDGLLFARSARSILAGDWLGQFNGITLAKGPGYPMFIAAARWSGLELKVAEQLVHLAAAAAVALAVLVVTRRRWPAVLGFVFLALDPSNFGANSSDVMRENLFASLGVLVLVVGFLTALAVVRRGRWVWLVTGAVGTGALVAGYWSTREEGVTILPPLAVTVLGVTITAVTAARRGARTTPAAGATPAGALRRGTLLRAGVALTLVAVTALLPLSLVRALNEARYGVAVLNDQGEGTFLRAYADWSRVDAGPRLLRVPITEEQRRAVYAVSPAARLLRTELEDPTNGWRSFECDQPVLADCDYRGGWMPWAIREAAEEAGRLDTAREGQEFFAALSSQITAACDDGRLDCAPALPASVQGIQRAPADLLAENVLVMLWDTIRATSLYEPPAGPVDVPREVRAEYAPAVAELPLSVRAAQEEMAQFQDDRALYEGLAGIYRALVPVMVLAGVVGLAIASFRALRGRPGVAYLPALAAGFAAGVVVRAFLLALIETADFDVPFRYLLPGYAMAVAFAVVGTAAGLPPRPRVPDEPSPLMPRRPRVRWPRTRWSRRGGVPDRSG